MTNEDKKTDNEKEYVLNIQHNDPAKTSLIPDKAAKIAPKQATQPKNNLLPSQLNQSSATPTILLPKEQADALSHVSLSGYKNSRIAPLDSSPQSDTANPRQQPMAADKQSPATAPDLSVSPMTVPQESTDPFIVYTDENQVEQAVEQPQESKHLSSMNYLSPRVALGVAVIIVLIGLFVLLPAGGGYKPFTVNNDKYSYTFLFYPDSVHSSTDINNQVTGDKDSVSAVAFESLWSENCNQKFPNIDVVSQASVQNQKFPVCAEPGEAIIFSSFKYNNVWQEVVVYSNDTTTKVSPTVANKTINSIKIN